MTFKVIYKPEAEQDITEIALWYESKKEGLGGDFIEAIHQKQDFLELNPEIYQIRYKQTRFALVGGFPYAIHFTLESNRVYVHAILSSERNPINWK